MSRCERIRAILEANFAPARLEITDESAKHASHAERNGVGGGETHYRILLISQGFEGQTRLIRSRAVHAALEPEFQTGLHALSMTLQTPESI